MAFESGLSQQVLHRPKAELVFRPWWDSVEDCVLSCMIAIGFLTLPTAYVTGNPVECVVHPNLWNRTVIWDPLGIGLVDRRGQSLDDEYMEENYGAPITQVRMTHWYVKRYCTENFVSKFVFYFPYILLTVPLTLVLVDRIFIKTFAAGNKIKQFYELLVEDSLQREDVENMSRENMKNLHEIMQSFRFSNVCYWSYLSRTILEIFLSIGLFLIYWCWGMPNLERDIDCDVHGLKHTCVLPNHQFYFYILTVSSALLCVYILCNLYNLVWIVWPQMGLMFRVIRKYRDHVDAPALNSIKKNKEGVISTDNFLNVYFDRRHKDLKLLLNLLAETSGLPESFRILTLFDKRFQSLWKPQNLRFEEYETVNPVQKTKSHSIIVRWNDAPIGHFLANYDSSLSFEYTIDIEPSPATELGLKSVLYKKEEEEECTGFMNGKTGHDSRNPECFNLLEGGTPNMSRTPNLNRNPDPPNQSHVDSFRYEVSFQNITQQEEEYTITISTELNGRTVTQTVEKFPMGQDN